MIPTIAALILAPSTPEGQWGPTSLTAVALAQKVDRALATLSGVTMHFTYVYDTTDAYAFKTCEGTFVSPTTFRFEMPVFDPKAKATVSFETWVADGKRFGRSFGRDNFPKPQTPVAQRPKGPAHPASVWFADCSRVMLSGAGQATHPVERFVAEARAQGFKLVVETRHLNFKGRNGVWYRLVASKGPARYETVFDAAGYLPVNVINKSGPKAQVRWYEVRWGKPKRIDASVARFIQPRSTTSPAPAPRPR